ncbi:hypothetical protein AVEN_81744-1 [Araneus ventricosus]|uniref:Uncharacterized protein n=1 Tax=Araneus ventricosus TaxID=182803 RepID=A0A4Y2UAQ6_ARAVE|nr:hypothetical protein AVEN_81744-1 [Araneus ventricosus]
MKENPHFKEILLNLRLHLPLRWNFKKFHLRGRLKNWMTWCRSKTKKMKVLQQKVRRYKTKINTLQDLISDLISKNFMDEDAIQILTTVSEVNKEFLNRQLASAKVTTMSSTFSLELRSFA